MSTRERLTLRPYQVSAVEGVESAWRGGVRRVAGVAATGAGKTIIFAEVARRAIAAGCPRVLVLAHREELLEQAYEKMRMMAPDLRVGRVGAGHSDRGARVVISSPQTMKNPKRLAGVRNVGLIITDEAHHSPAATYRAVYDHYGAFKPDGARMLGVTATMVRSDRKRLGEIWEKLSFNIPIKNLVIDGYLVPPVGKHVFVADLDLDRVKKTAGDLAAGDLGRALADSMAPKKIVEAMLEHAIDRRGFVFTPSIEFAEIMAEAINATGGALGRAEIVSYNTPKDERKRILQAFRGGSVRWLCNAMLLTEGTDLPMADCAVIARPTKSAGLFTQMVGRILRLWREGGKKDGLVLDVTGVSRSHSLAGLTDLGLDDESRPEREKNEIDELMVDIGDLGDLIEGAGLGPAEQDEPEYVNGVLRSELVDLFGGSAHGWLRTRAGTWFLPVGSSFIAVVPDRWTGTTGAWAAVRFEATPGLSRIIQTGLTEVSWAMAWGEHDVRADELMYVTKSQSWRRQKPSDRQLDMARMVGIDGAVTMRRGELSDAISVAKASARIDTVALAQ